MARRRSALSSCGGGGDGGGGANGGGSKVDIRWSDCSRHERASERASDPAARLPTRIAGATHHEPELRDAMPKPGFHKELQSDLSALGKKHPDLAKAIAAAKKAKK